MKRIVILISGRGSNMEAIVRCCAEQGWPARVVAVIANSAALVTIYNLFIRVYSSIGKRFRLVRNDEEAYALLKIPSKSL